MTGVDADLATLHPGTREFLSEYADRLATIKGYPVHAQEIRKVLSWADGAEAELSRLRELCVAIDTGTFDTQRERAEAAEARCARLQQALERIAADSDQWCEAQCGHVAREALAGPDAPAIPPRPPIQPPGHQREMADTPADSQEGE